MLAAHCPICGGSLRRLFGFPNGRHVARCPDCGLRRLLPAPTAEELATLYGRKEYYTEDLASLHDDLTADYDEASAIVKLYRRHLEKLAKILPAPARLLEVGCARGVFLDMARKTGYEVSGVDMNGYAAQYAREHFGIDVAARPFEAYDAPPGSFDAVVSVDVIEHVADPAVFIGRISSLLRPGGIAIIGTPDTSSLLYLTAECGARLSGGRWNYPARRLYGNGLEHLTMFNRQNLERLLRSKGLKPIGTYGYSIPLRNMRDVKGIYGPAMAALGRMPYEFVMMARKG